MNFSSDFLKAFVFCVIATSVGILSVSGLAVIIDDVFPIREIWANIFALFGLSALVGLTYAADKAAFRRELRRGRS